MASKTKPHSVYPAASDHPFPLNISPYRYASSVAASSTELKLPAQHTNMPTYTQTRTSPLNLLSNHQSPPNIVETPTIIKPISLPIHQENSSYSQISKHWIWNSNFFYPTTSSRSMPLDGFIPYSANISEIFSANNKSRLLQRTQNASDDFGSDSTTKTIDLSQQSSEANSDDSLDTDSFTNEDSSSLVNKSLPSSSTVALAMKKKNPYSIEELLKKPDKKRKIESSIANTFQPAIIIHDRQTHSKHEIITDDSSSDDVQFDRSNVAIDVCD